MTQDQVPRVSSLCRRPVAAFRAGVLLCLLLGPQALPAAELGARMRVAINLFPAFVSALEPDPAAQPRHELLLLYQVSDGSVDAIHAQLASRLERHAPHLVLSAMPVAAWLSENGQPGVAAVFIAQHLDRAVLDAVLRKAGARRVLTFSPFAGDIARGVLGGISVTDRILPKVNAATLRAHAIRLKPFFLRVADLYE